MYSCMFFRLVSNFRLLRTESGIPSKNDRPLYETFKIDQSDFQRPFTSKIDDTFGEDVSQDLPYQRFWKHVTQEVIPTWRSKGAIPKEVMRPLLEFVEFYFSAKEDKELGTKLKEQLETWANLLQGFSIDDVNCLLGQVIKYYDATRELYAHLSLIEILISFLHGENPDLNYMMIGIAEFLCEYDASYIADTALIATDIELKRIYAHRRIGPEFYASDLDDALGKLPIIPGSKVADRITVLRGDLVGKSRIDTQALGLLLEIFRLRWVKMLEKEKAGKEPFDYFSHQDGDNAAWIHLARVVSGAKLLELLLDDKSKPKHNGNIQHFVKNWMRILVPGIQDTDPIRLMCVADDELHNYILDNNGDSLISLKNCVTYSEQHKRDGHARFLNAHSTQHMPLTLLEIKRMKRANPIFHHYLPLAIRGFEMDDLPLSVGTLRAIDELVKSSFLLEKLKKGQEYTPDEMLAATKAFQNFHKLMRDKTGDEMERLERQRIIFGPKHNTYLEVVTKIYKGEEDGCVATCSRFFMVLLEQYGIKQDYLPFVLNSAGYGPQSIIKKVFREYDHISEAEAKRRLKILIVSVMTHYFQFELVGNVVTFWDCSNAMVDVSAAIFNLLESFIRHDGGKDARHVYATIIELVVNPALKAKTWLRYPDTYKWLESISNETLFTQGSLWFEPEFLLTKLTAMQKIEPVFKDKLAKFVDEFCRTYAQKSATNFEKALRVNIKFVKELQALDEGTKSKVMVSISFPLSRQEKQVDFYDIYTNCLASRVAIVGASNMLSGLFFGSRPVMDKEKAEIFARALQRSKSPPLSIDRTPEKVLINIRANIEKLVGCSSEEKQKMTVYIHGIEGTIAEPTRLHRNSRSPIPQLLNGLISPTLSKVDDSKGQTTTSSVSHFSAIGMI